MQYLFQAWGNRAPTPKYRDMLLHTATQELGHIEMLATAVALNLDKAPASLQEEGATARAVRLLNAAHDKGMKKMLHYMIARDMMHQQQ